jgi:hypothetical protein
MCADLRAADADIKASPEHKAVVEFLRGKNGPKVRRGILNGKRVDYFKGKLLLPPGHWARQGRT